MTKKFTFLLMAFLALAGFKSWGQQTLPYSYGFENNDLAAAGWTTVNYSPENAGEFGIFDYAKHNGSYGFQFSSYTQNNYGNYNQYLISPQISASSDFVFQFYYAKRDQWGSETFRVGYSTTDNQLDSFYYGDDIYVSSQNWMLSEEFSFPAETKYIAIHYHSNYQYRLYVDDFTFTALNSCPKPTDLTASNITGSGASITWNGSVDSYKVVYGPAEGFNPDEIQPETVSETTYTISNLTTDVTYSIAVKAVCSAEEESDWSQTYSFTPTCPTVNINQWNIETTAVTAYIPWSVEGYVESFSLAYGLANDFNLDDENTYTLVENITNAYYELSNLTSGTEYKCAVKALCDGNTEGNWSNVVSFTPSCPAPSLNSYSGINLTPTTATISWNSNKDFIENYTLVYGLAETFDLENPSTYNSVNVVPDEYGYASYTIQNLTTNVSYKCAARSSCDGSTQSVWSNVVTFMPFIEAPNGLTVSNIKATSATASWNASENAVTYTVAYGLANGFNLNDPTTYQTTEPTSATSVEITGLTADQNYACAVKSTNAESIDSKWSNPVYFMPTAKQTLVANDGTNYYSHAPFYGGGIIEGMSSGQFIIPASELQQMSGSSILSFEFSLYSSPWHQCQGNWEVYLEEVENTTYSSASFIEDNTMQLVYSGDFYVSDKLSVTFTTPFEYNGGNLMVYFKQTQAATSWDVWTPWYGVETSDYTSIGYEDYNYQINLYRYNFLPKTTITYIPAEKFAIALMQPEDEDEIGTIAANMTEAAEGNTVTLSFNPKQYDDHSYKISSWNVTKTGDETVTVTVAADNTFEMPAYPVTVSAVIEEVTYYALTIDEEIEGGTIEADPTEHLEFGQQVELSASPALHYRFVGWNITKVPSGDAFIVPALPNTSFNMPASALNVSATFEAYLPHTIALPAPVEEGYVTASQTEGLYCYDNVTLTVHPSEHCSLQSIAIVTGETPVSYTQDGNDYYFTMPDGDVTVTATFVENSKYNVTLVYDEEGGSITLQDGNTEYYAGDRVNLSVAANTGYILLSLEAEDSEHNPVTITNNQFVMPESAVTVTAVFVHGIIVNDGNNTNGYVPINGYNTDAYTKSQFIIPESGLDDMKNGKIKSMVFYLDNSSDSHTFNGKWKVYIKNVLSTTTTLSNYETLSAEEKVYEGDMVIANGKMTVNIPEENQYEYRGGNLLIGFEQTQTGSWHTTNWLGVNQSSNTAYAGYTSWGYDYSQARQFLPKVTFLYEPGEPLPEYDITFHSNGIVSGQTITEGQSLPNPTNIPAGLAFAGWATEDIETYYNEEQAEQIEYVTAARAEEDLYAVFSYSETETASKGEGTWTKVTDVNELVNNDKVVLVYSNKILGQRGSDDYSFTALSNDLTIVGDAITNIPDNAIEFTLQQNGEYWNLNYYDAKENEATSIATFDFYLVPDSYGWGSNNWAAESNSGAVVFKTDGNARYIGYNSNVMKVVNSSGNKCNVYKAGAPVVTKTYYMTEVLTNGAVADLTTNNIIVASPITVSGRLEMNAEGLFRNENAANFVFADGAQFYYTGEATVLATFEKTINAYTGDYDNYYFIANPTDEENVDGLGWEGFDLYTFNAATDGEGNEWINEGYVWNTDIERGTGYLYANQYGTTLSFAGELIPANSPDYSRKSLILAAAGEGRDFPGFNLIGNPFACNVYLDKPAYLLDGGEYQPIAANTAIAPCEGFFVEAESDGENLSISTSDPGLRGNSISLTVSQNRGNIIDRAIVSFDGSSNLHKFMLNPAHTNIHLAKNGEDFAALSSDAEGEIPVSFKAEKDGTYTITVNTENVEAQYLHLIDNMTGMDTDLLSTSSYTFNASTSDYAYRFKLVFNMNIDEANGSNANSFAYISNGNLVIDNIEGEATMQIVDMLGRVISTEIVSGSYNKALNLNAGLYIINLNGMTQKIVVK